MKAIWIKRGIPMVVAIMVITIGVVSCALDPLSSNNSVQETDNNDSQIYVSPSGSEIPDVSSPMEAPVRISAFGILKLDASGVCWYLMEKPKVGIELHLKDDILRPEDEGRLAMVHGIESWQTKPVCSEFFSVFIVNTIEFKQEYCE